MVGALDFSNLSVRFCGPARRRVYLYAFGRCRVGFYRAGARTETLLPTVARVLRRFGCLLFNGKLSFRTRRKSGAPFDGTMDGARRSGAFVGVGVSRPVSRALGHGPNKADRVRLVNYRRKLFQPNLIRNRGGFAFPDRDRRHRAFSSRRGLALAAT